MIKTNRQISNYDLRYLLARIWDPNKLRILFIGYNPTSRRDDINDELTNALIEFTHSIDYGGFYLANAYPNVSGTESDLTGIMGKTNLGVIEHHLRIAKKVIYVWGNNKIPQELERILYESCPNAECFGKNYNGTPCNPKFLKGNLKLQNYYEKDSSSISNS